MSIFISQSFKYLIVASAAKKIPSFKQSYASGNFPSTHSAAVTSLVVVIALKDGTDCGLFGLAFLIAVIVMYDSVNVRRTVGDQGKAIRELLESLKSTVFLPNSAKGHSPREILAGAIVGSVVGAVVFSATN